MFGNDLVRRKRDRSGKGLIFNFNRRSLVLLGFLGTLLVAVVVSAFQRQVLEREFLREEGEARYLRDWEIPARRGMILDRNGEPLAVSSPVASVWTDPRKLKDYPEAMGELADAMGIAKKDLKQRVADRQTKGFIYLKRRIDPDQAQDVERIKAQYQIHELGMETEYKRFYPGGEIFGHIIGFTDVDDKGIEGMELAFNGWLGAELLFTEQDVVICPLPLFHVFAAYPGMMSVIFSGAHMVFPTPAGFRGDGVFDNFWKLVERWKATFVYTVPTAISALMQRKVNADISTLQGGFSGSAALPVELYKRFQQATGVSILEGYGLTEATCLVSINPPTGIKKIGSVGLPFRPSLLLNPRESLHECSSLKDKPVHEDLLQGGSK